MLRASIVHPGLQVNTLRETYRNELGQIKEAMLNLTIENDQLQRSISL